MDHFLGIGGLIIAVRCPDARIRCAWDGPLRPFLTAPATPDVDLTAEVMRATPTGGEVVFDSDGVWRMLRDSAGYRLECRSAALGPEPYKVGLFDETFTRGTILMRENVLDLNPLDYPLDEVLLSNLLGRGRGVELHSCGVIDRQGRGHLFVGVSGAGKTTTARLWDEAAAGIVSDDRVIVRDHEGTMWMYGTPWHGEAELSLATRAPLAGVYLLVQSDANALRPLTQAAAVAGLFRCTFPLFYDSRALDFTLSFLARIAESVPVRELHFLRDRSVVDLVLESAKGAAA